MLPHRVPALVRPLLLVFLMLVPAWGGAAAAAPLEVLAAGSVGGPAWVAVKIASGGERIEVDVDAAGARATFLAIYLVDADGRLRSRATQAPVAYPSDGVGVDVEAASASRRAASYEAPRWGGPASVALSVNAPTDVVPIRGDLTLVLIVAGEADAWTYEVRAVEATLRAVMSGERTFYRSARDFGGAVHAEAYEDGVGGRAHAASRALVRVEGSLFGAAVVVGTKTVCAPAPCAAPPGSASLVAQAPARALAMNCACEFAGASSGEYVFTLTGADASSDRHARACQRIGQWEPCVVAVPGAAQVVVAGADVALG